MILKNLRDGKTICKNLKICESFLDRFLGLLRKSNPRSLMFKTRFGVHTFFLNESIDVLILDRNLKVVCVEQVKPNRFYFWNPKYFNVLELTHNSIATGNIKVGDLLIIS